MEKIRSVKLKGRVPGGAGLEFERVEMPAGYDPPFALVRYSLCGEEQDTGLRLDLDKRVFLDHFEDQKEREAVIEQAAPRIVDLLHSDLYHTGSMVPFDVPSRAGPTPKETRIAK